MEAVRGQLGMGVMHHTGSARFRTRAININRAKSEKDGGQWDTHNQGYCHIWEMYHHIWVN